MIGAEAMRSLEEHLGPELLAEVVAAWITEHHKARPLLLFNPKPKAPARAPHYLGFVRTLECCNCGKPPRSQPDHIGPRGMGQKTDDYRTIPLCHQCHHLRQTGKMPVFPWREHMIRTLVLYLRWVEQR